MEGLILTRTEVFELVVHGVGVAHPWNATRHLSSRHGPNLGDYELNCYGTVVTGRLWNGGDRRAPAHDDVFVIRNSGGFEGHKGRHRGRILGDNHRSDRGRT